MKKIMFNDRYGFTEAVLSGRKTMTRRLISQSTLKKVDDFMVDYHNQTLDSLTELEALNQYFFVEEIGKLPYNVGEVVAIAQRYRDLIPNPISIPADMGWFNKLFVRADQMPHQIRITNVRVEKLQDIGDVDCLAEGIEFSHKAQSFYVKNDSTTGAQTWLGNTPREAYAALIDRISGKGTWDSNPFVFVYEFELVK